MTALATSGNVATLFILPILSTLTADSSLTKLHCLYAMGRIKKGGSDA
jgi:hypothetical protein